MKCTTMPFKIYPSLLSADWGRFRDDVQAFETLPIAGFHVDIMDNHFVPNLTFGPALMDALAPHSPHPFDAHLMVEKAAGFVPLCRNARAVFIHTEHHAHSAAGTLRTIKDAGLMAGVAINPGTPMEKLWPLLPVVDKILVMTVEPGFGGQAFMADQLPKIAEISAVVEAKGLAIEIIVDGGIDPETIQQIQRVGAHSAVVGNALFHGAPATHRGAFFEQRLKELRPMS